MYSHPYNDFRRAFDDFDRSMLNWDRGVWDDDWGESDWNKRDQSSQWNKGGNQQQQQLSGGQQWNKGDQRLGSAGNQQLATRDQGSQLGSWRGNWGNLGSMNQAIKLDLIENKDNYLVHADVAGIPKENVKINLDDGLLTISGERSGGHTDQSQNGNYIRRERHYGNVSRSIRLPKDIDQNSVKAKFEHGVLSVTVPRVESKSGRQIQIS